jgi:hypothetical protein
VGTISNLIERLSRRSKPDLSPIVVSAFGFTVGQVFVPWQTVAEIWGYKVDLLTTDEAFLEFSSNGQSISVSEEQPGFDQLESAMVAAFPATAIWRQAVLQPAFDRCRTLLYRRA